jgi:hypothetical protein
MYKEQVIHFKGGINEWMGELDQAPHKMGKNWYRINNPVMIRYLGDGRLGLTAIQGPDNMYKKFIDIRVPEDSILEILTVDREGGLYKAYIKESAREKSNIIVSPNSGLKLV